jgi:hypothetical protein
MPTAAPAISALCVSAKLTAVWKPEFAFFHAWSQDDPEPWSFFFGAAPPAAYRPAPGPTARCRRMAGQLLASVRVAVARRFPLASLMLTRLVFAYAYPFCCCGSPWSTTASAEMNLPTVGSYSRAPRWVSPVGSTVPPTNPFSFGQLGTVPLAPPNGVSRRTCAVVGLLAEIAIVDVPCWSDISQVTPAAVRIATNRPACV